jgi:hypothetical protein
MKGFIFQAAVATASALVLTAWCSSSRADETWRDQQSPASDLSRVSSPMVVSPARDVITIEEKVPNAALITSGAVMLGIPLAASTVVASTSSRESDRYLYAPVVGPWMDLARRGECAGPDCGVNTTRDNVLLVANGILQGAGALQIAAGFIFPRTKTVTRTTGVHVTPTGLGLAAYGSF